MKWLIKNAIVVYPNHPLNGKKRDILVHNGKIAQIASSIKDEKAEKITSKNLHVSIGWFDLRANFCDPGFEYKEDIESGLAASAKGGFTGVAVLPNTLPVTDHKGAVKYILKQGANHLVDIHPLGAVSIQTAGKNLAELYDMSMAGAVAFTDGNKAIANANLMYRALLYAQNFDGLVMNMPNNEAISSEGQMSEGEVSTQLGLKGIPSIAEELMINRDLYLLEYTGGKLHIGPISSAKAVSLIKEGKRNKLDISSEVSMANLIFNDTKLEGFDSQYKVFPPLRNQKTINTLIKGLKEGTIDVISSNHTPENIENKDVEFDHAAFGIVMSETLYSLYNEHLSEKLDLAVFVEKVAFNPRNILRLEVPQLEEGVTANLTCFDPSISWTYDQKTMVSKSANSPVMGQELKGKVVAVLNNGQATIH